MLPWIIRSESKLYAIKQNPEIRTWKTRTQYQKAISAREEGGWGWREKEENRWFDLDIATKIAWWVLQKDKMMDAWYELQAPTLKSCMVKSTLKPKTHLKNHDEVLNLRTSDKLLEQSSGSLRRREGSPCQLADSYYEIESIREQIVA